MASENGAVASEARAYWSQFEPQHYSREGVLADYAVDAERTGVCSRHVAATFGSDVREALPVAGAASGMPLYSAFVTAAVFVLAQHAGSRRLLLAIPGGKPGSQGELPLFVDLSGVHSFREGLNAVRARLDELRHYGELPLAEIRAECGLGLKEGEALAGLLLRSRAIHGPLEGKQRSRIELIEASDGVACEWHYDAGVYRPETIGVVLTQILDVLHRGLTSLDAPSWQLLAQLFSRSSRPADEMLVTRSAALPLGVQFEKICEQQSDYIASVCGEERLTYGAVRALSHRIASQLRALSLDPGTPIGVLLTSEHWRLAATLGVLHAGHVHVVLHHTERPGALSLLLRTVDVREVVTERPLVRLLRDCSVRSHYVEDLSATTVRHSATEQGPALSASLVPVSSLGDLPQVAELDHDALAKEVDDFTRRLSIRSADCILEVVPAHIAEPRIAMYGCAVTGARFVSVMEDQHSAPAQWSALLDRERVSILHSTPELIEALLSYFREFPHLIPACPALRAILFASRSVSAPLAERLRQLWRDVQLLCAADGIFGLIRLRPEPNTGRALPVELMPGDAVRVLSMSGDPCPTSVRGRVYLNSTGAVRGYWKDARATASRLVPGAESELPGTRLLQTNQIARFLPDGLLEFLDAAHAGFSLHGTWVRLDAFERLIVRVTGVKAAAVVATADGSGGFLIDVHVQASPDRPFDEERATRELRQWLPTPLLPRRFVPVTELPYLPTGELDRDALGRGQFARTDAESGGDALTSRICGLFAGLLEVDSVGPDDDFFTLGGYSILAIELVAQLKDTFQVDVPLSDVFEFPTPARLAERVMGEAGACSTELPEVTPRDRAEVAL